MAETGIINDFIRERMRARGWTIPHLADVCEVAVGLAQRWVSENPRYRVTPSPASCEKIAAALGEDADRILELAGHRQPREPRVEINAHLAAFLSQIEAGWLAMEPPERDVAERGTRALFSVPGSHIRDHTASHATDRVTHLRGRSVAPSQEPDTPEHRGKNRLRRSVTPTPAAA